MRQGFSKKASELLRTRQMGGQSVHTIEADNPRSIALLEKAYKEVYESAFPINEERESLETWLNNLKGKNPAANIVIVVAGDDLDTQDPTLKAISVAYYYNEHDAGLLAYNAVSPKFQGHGLGRTMVDARKEALLDFAKTKGKALGGVFIECNDPAKVSAEEDVMDPTVRINIFEKWGAVVLPIDYVQPPLETGGERCSTLKLLAYPHPQTGHYPTKDEIKAYLTGIYTELAKYSGHPPEKDPDYNKSVQQLEALDLGQFYKTMLAAKASAKQKPPSPN